MALTDTAETIQRAASAATYGGATGAAVSGGAPLVLGLPTDVWSVIGVLAGICFAAAGYFTSLYFQIERRRSERAQADPGA